MLFVKDLLNKWFEIAKYDENQTSFNLLSENYAFHQVCKRMTELLKFDDSGVFSLLYAKASFETICKDLTFNVFDYLTRPGCLDEYVSMWLDFNCFQMVEIESATIQNIIRLTNMNPVIGESDNQKELNIFRDSIEYIAEELTQCKSEAFYVESGTKISNDIKFKTTLNVFNTTTECILSIENKPDGLYLCYISDFNSIGGYFTYVLKSGRNIISINDRVDENFVGMHTKSRNNRFIENKNWHIFPYKEIVSLQGQDYLGYAKSLVCNVESKEISELSPNAVYPIMLAATLILKKYCGKSVDTLLSDSVITQVYIDSLLYTNIDTTEVKSLMVVSSDKSMVCAHNSELKFNFNSKAIKDNSLQSKFNYHHKDNNSRYTGTYTDANKILIDTYADDFVLNSDKIMRRSWPQLTDGNSDASTVISEFIGPVDKIELEYYRQSRMQLKYHILAGMQVAYQEAGCYEGVKEWYKNAIHKNIDNIKNMAVDFYIENGGQLVSDISPYSIPCGDRMSISICADESGWCQPRVLYDFVLNEGKPHKSGHMYYPPESYYCPVTQNTANIWFIFEPNTFENIQLLAGQEVPKILKGFKYSGVSAGNPIINSVDPVGFIHNPFENNVPTEYNELFPKHQSCNFSVAIGFSKRGLNQLVKERKNGESLNTM